MRIDINVPDGISGNWAVESFTVEDGDTSQFISALKYGRSVPGGKYKRLVRNGTTVMSNTPDEIRDFLPFTFKAHGSIIINGLGLGVLLKKLLSKDDVTEITVIEKSYDVINLVAETYLKDKRVSIICADAFEFKPPKGKQYNYAWHDIWDYICSDNLKEMHTLHRKYGRRVDYQESWCRAQCERQKNANKRYYH